MVGTGMYGKKGGQGEERWENIHTGGRVQYTTEIGRVYEEGRKRNTTRLGRRDHKLLSKRAGK